MEAERNWGYPCVLRSMPRHQTHYLYVGCQGPDEGNHLRWHRLPCNSDRSSHSGEEPSHAQGIRFFHVHCWTISRSHNLVGHGDFYVSLEVGKERRVTQTVGLTSDPEWNEDFSLWVAVGSYWQHFHLTIGLHSELTSAPNEGLSVTVWDRCDQHADERVGGATVAMDQGAIETGKDVRGAHLLDKEVLPRRCAPLPGFDTFMKSNYRDVLSYHWQ